MKANYILSKKMKNENIECEIISNGKIVMKFHVPANVGWTNNMIAKYARFLLQN